MYKYAHLLLLWLSQAFASGGHFLPKEKHPLTRSSGFSPVESENLVGYYGHSTNTLDASMAPLCQDPSLDLVVMGFIRDFRPTLDLEECSHNASQDFDTVIRCPLLASQISLCQEAGKKVFASIGGFSSNTSFPSKQAAQDAAGLLWNILGPGSGSPQIRPFGTVAIDGFDIGTSFTFSKTMEASNVQKITNRDRGITMTHF